MNKVLKEYYIACNNVVSEFVGKYFDCEQVTWQINDNNCVYGDEFIASDGYDDGDTCYGFWINKEVGGVIEISDYFFNMDRMAEALKLKATKKQLFDYYDLEVNRDGKVGYNFKNFVRYGKEQMEEVIKKK